MGQLNYLGLVLHELKMGWCLQLDLLGSHQTVLGTRSFWRTWPKGCRQERKMKWDPTNRRGHRRKRQEWMVLRSVMTQIGKEMCCARHQACNQREGSEVGTEGGRARERKRRVRRKKSVWRRTKERETMRESWRPCKWVSDSTSSWERATQVCAPEVREVVCSKFRDPLLTMVDGLPLPFVGVYNDIGILGLLEGSVTSNIDFTF